MMAYKIFDLHNGSPKTLFHGVKGSRLLPVNVWVEAEEKWCIDGSRQTKYLSGFHAYRTKEDVKNWIRRAKNLINRVVVQVEIEELRLKPNAVRPTILAKRMFISKKNWEERIPAIKF